jgi:2',3'-cyclic-nucleotide 2'-phosphodiesterase (5'-nucleotidase family)
MKIYPFSLIILSLVLVFSCKTSKKNYLADEKASYYRMSQSEIDSTAEKLIATYRDKMKNEMDETIGVLKTALYKGSPESTLGNWLADLLHKQVEEKYKKPIDFTVLNLGGLRVPSLPEGNITKGNIFELLPFENALCLVEMDSAQVVQLILHITKKGGWPISHARYVIYNLKVKDFKINGYPLTGNKKYTIAMPDYIANGGDNTPIVKELTKINLQLLLREATIDYITKQKMKPMSAEFDDRIIVVNE